MYNFINNLKKDDLKNNFIIIFLGTLIYVISFLISYKIFNYAGTILENFAVLTSYVCTLLVVFEKRLNFMRVFDGNQLYTNLNQIDFKNKIAKGINSKGEDFEINFINLDYPIRIKSGDQDIYENDIVSYLNNNWKIVFDYTKGIFGVRKENKKKYKIYLGPGLKIVGNIYMKEFEEFKGL